MMGHICSPGRFMWGNLESLNHQPEIHLNFPFSKTRKRHVLAFCKARIFLNRQKTTPSCIDHDADFFFPGWYSRASSLKM